MNLTTLNNMTAEELIHFLKTQDLFGLEKLMLKHLIEQQQLLNKLMGVNND